ncbi:MAG: glutamine-hydrolyzing carbamoyl-phosphate synthase small subunit [Simkaniaceae bacterium]
MVPTTLYLESGETFQGKSPEGQADSYGEVVFTTSMAGYVETLTDPSFAGQIICFTYPLIGNYGVPRAEEWESRKIFAKGVIVSELAPFQSHRSAERSLSSWLQSQEVPLITNVDTRALTKRLREKGVIPGVIAASKAPKQFYQFNQSNLLKEVSIETPVSHGSGKKKIIAVDCGMKENIMRCLLQLPLSIKRVPYNYDYTLEDCDGLFLSNGPGDPSVCKETIAILKKFLETRNLPVFGICLGSQLLAEAIGAKTYKLRYGHRGQNQPVMELSSGRCFLTSQNHGYAIDERSLPAGWQVNFRNLNDQTVEGIFHADRPVFAVQFHPEAAPGPQDTQWLFEQFYQLL